MRESPGLERFEPLTSTQVFGVTGFSLAAFAARVIVGECCPQAVGRIT
jgi:hypothetical protein